MMMMMMMMMTVIVKLVYSTIPSRWSYSDS